MPTENKDMLREIDSITSDEVKLTIGKHIEPGITEEATCIIKTESVNNNGGITNYYDLPPESGRPCIDDLIEYKEMQRWRAEIFKSMYGWEGRAARSSDGSSSEERELNKCYYYLDRKRSLMGLPIIESQEAKDKFAAMVCKYEKILEEKEANLKHLSKELTLLLTSPRR